jgi:hypothetical protein
MRFECACQRGFERLQSCHHPGIGGPDMSHAHTGCDLVEEADRGTQKTDNHMAGKAKRTTHRSSSGKKLYAVRDKSGRFKDIQTYERAHRADLARKSKSES